MMFKLVVLCFSLAVAVAKPGTLIAAPLAYSSTILSPATATITQQASSVVHPTPLQYSAPLAYTHFIKKRSTPLVLSSYIAPTTYAASTPIVTSAFTTPLIHSAPVLSAAPLTYAAPTHLIKKRSTALLPTTYIAPTTYAATTPLLTSTYTAATPFISSTPLISSAPIAYSTHLIKKRSTPLAVSTYTLAPSSFSHQSRVDLHSTPFITSYTTPLAYSSPLVSHVL